MFAILGNWVNRYWLAILLFWGALAIVLKLVAPSWDQVALDGDFDYLPSNSTSRRGIALLHEAFPDEQAKSQIVLVFARPDKPLSKLDRQFAIDVAGQLSQLGQESFNVLDNIRSRLGQEHSIPPDKVHLNTMLVAPPAPEETENEDSAVADDKQAPSLGLTQQQADKLIEAVCDEHNLPVPDSATTPIVSVGDLVAYVTDDFPWADDNTRVWTELTPVVGQMLKNAGRGKPSPGDASNDGRNLDDHAVMVVGRLTTDMMATENVWILQAVKRLVEEARTSPDKPEGLAVGLSGSGMIGGDMQLSIGESLKSTELTTIVLVLLCLLMIYRSPLLVLIPMATIGVSLSVASDVVALMAQYLGPGDLTIAGLSSDFKIFTTTKIFVVVILFGAGTDFCLFLIARFKEELGLGVELSKASGTALTHVGDALAASAFTTILGLATMFFASYGKFVYSGPVIAICLFIALLACITFAPALLRAFGKVVFWPFGIKHLTPPEESNLSFDEQMKRISPIWDWVARQVIRWPGLILWLSFGIAAPFMFNGLSVQKTHDFMNELAEDRASKLGTELIRDYFPPGESAPMSVVAKLPNGNLNDDSDYSIAYLNTLLYNLPGVVDVRSLYKPIGGDPTSGKNIGAATLAGSPLAKTAFVSETGKYAGKVTQLHLVLDKDPFSREARAIVNEIEKRLEMVSKGEEFPAEKPEWFAGTQDNWDVMREGISKWKGATFEFIGTTPGMRDLERVTTADETTIKVLVVLAVLAVIIVILRRPLVCLYLIVTVLLSYFATIGMTDFFFRWYYGDTFDGLDWKVPIFLFVILIAVGQDYNIYLTTRVFEEQSRLGPRRGLRRAMVQTGGIITSCGIIMAGTFIAMASGTLRGMIEIGFALALGVLLDTFFVRTVVVPCFFALMAGKEDEPGEPQGVNNEGKALGEDAAHRGSSPHHSGSSQVTETAS